MIELTTARVDGTTVVRIAGRLDALTSERIRPQLMELGALNALVFDLSALNYLSSAGLKLLLTVQGSVGRVAVYGLQGLCREVFEVSGVAQSLMLVGDQPRALAAVKLPTS